ncbi:MAG TPA: macro domain-containing protein [Thermotogota bacterium]|nr:macro domain-containing protein [Thermotogota bacterium]HRW34645.1 macro domain-containing protein [Thermotogota bacterium]
MKKISIFNHAIEIVKGDITKENTEAIVNAANSALQHGGGVALAISSAAGKELRTECEQYISQHGEVPTGSAMITTGGNLKVKYVIHTVGPIWGSGNEDEKLKNAIISCLEICEKHSLKSCSIPAISSGIYGFPKERCAKIFFQVLIGYFHEHPNSNITLIRLCNIDEKTCSIFEKISNQVHL